MIVFPILIFISVTLGLVGLFFWLTPTRTSQRLQAIAQPAEKSEWMETVVGIVSPFAKLSTPTGNWETSPLRVKFINAGIRRNDARLIYFGLKTLLPLLFAGIAYFGLRSGAHTDNNLTFLLYLMSAALIGCYLPNAFLHWMAKTRKREIFENFPDAADLMLVCVEAGLGLDAALTKVADEIRIKSVALAEEIHLTNLEMRAGGTREKSLRNLALRTGVEEIGTFATMLTQADKFGTSIGESLRVFSDDLRYKRQIRAEETAARIPTKLLFPLVVCIFPAIIMVIMGPAVIQLLRTVLPMMSGTAT
ncbi:type II secretion system F family protein [Noviherbaspirillum cavernae]|uniref:Type II secretion system F family protein n=1 Tax=Noviherbaspirillum cavernae TaxID=2320862 RepID=A0A418WWC0_9BURK|nr:type II secretion system F family protein [Noviherbaspirillum cavernae]RJF96963.1 type II secretion system F family protein [Noviherbaspirillum cavernae]